MEYIAHIMKDVKTKSYIGMKRLAENKESCNKPILGFMTNDDDQYFKIVLI
jgi:hypothetical protein